MSSTNRKIEVVRAYHVARQVAVAAAGVAFVRAFVYFWGLFEENRRALNIIRRDCCRRLVYRVSGARQPTHRRADIFFITENVDENEIRR